VRARARVCVCVCVCVCMCGAMGGESGKGYSPERIRLGKLSIADAAGLRSRDDPWTKFVPGRRRRR